MKILALECATEHCSAALWQAGEISERTLPPGRGQSEQLLLLVEVLLSDAGLGLPEIDLLAVGRGPGAFTGVRMAVGVAQGLAYAAQLPLVAVSTLRTVAQAASIGYSQVLVCQDARMGEVYWGAFAVRDGIAHAAGAEQVSKPESVVLPTDWDPGCGAGAGSGFAAYPTLTEPWASGLAVVLSGCHARAAAVATLAAHDGLACARDPADVQPVYLRNDVAFPPSQK